MTKTSQLTQTMPTQRKIGQTPLSLCSLSPLNPRQIVTEAEITGLAQSIRAIGLVQNLAGLEADDGRVEIVAGGRRLRALQRIAEEDKADSAAILVPVLLAANAAEARVLASAENTARADLHPADEITAYRHMAAAGMDCSDIAKAFAVTERHVRGRMRLAGLAAPVLAALKADEITLDIAAAYTLSGDQDQQCAVFDEVRAGPAWVNTAREIRARLMAEAARPSDRLAKFVGRAAYEAAGGAIREDLFGEEVFFLDPELLAKEATAKLEVAAEALRAEGWRWVETGFERPSYEATRAMGRTYPETVAASDDEVGRAEALDQLIADGAASPSETEEFEALSAKLERQSFSEAQRRHAGVILWIGYDGAAEAEHGLVRPEDRAEAEAVGVCAPSRHPCPAPAPKPTRPYSAALARDLAAVRTAALQTAVLDNPELARDLLTFVLSTSMAPDAAPLGIRIEAAQRAPQSETGLNLPKALRAAETPAEPPALPLTAKCAAAAFTAFQRKKPATKARLLTEAVADCLSIGLADDAANPLAEMIAAQAGLDLRRIWTPGAAFLGRLKASQLDQIMAEISSTGVPQSFQKMKKREKVARLDKIFRGGPGLPPMTEPEIARAAAWVPAGMSGAQKSASAAETASAARRKVVEG